MERRSFLLSGAAFASAATGWAGANDRLRLGILGTGGRGRALLREAAPMANVEIAALCDPDSQRMDQANADLVERTGKKAVLHADLRRVLDDKSIDAVLIASTNHWHAPSAIWACQAGKHVYVEKPVSHNFVEGQKLVEAARRYKRIAQGGTQRRSWGLWKKVAKTIHDGTIGDVYLSKWVFPGSRESIGFKSPEAPPANLNWDLWLGPAPDQPYHANLVHYNWHWFWDFGNGELGNNGIHLVDVSRWMMKRGLPSRVVSVGGRYGYRDQAETPNTQTTTWTYDDGAAIVGEIRDLYTAETMSWDFFGTKGHLHCDGDKQFVIRFGRDKELQPPVTDSERANHIENFAAAIRANKPELLAAEIEQTAISTAMCHLGNISYRVGRELRFDVGQAQFDDDAANALLRRSYRAPYRV
ncbi:MAG: Gfo/Idh/MocA family oxidoreductase [Bryobacterales bacterium]|nr:Gfo/Idh/MocA family oxidoreductase [Bryobacterales bacterium]